MLKPRLYLHAEPHMDESSASWLIRTSELHGLTLKELFSALKVRKRRDLDLAVVPRVLDYFTRGMDYPTETLRQMTRFYQAFRRERWTHVWLKRLHGGAPGTGYCPACLTDDRQPYWRATWRFRFWTVCPQHGCSILHECPACEAPVVVSGYFQRRPFLTGLSLCTTCACCGADLRTAIVEPHQEEFMALEDLVARQKAITAAFLRGTFRLFGIEEDLPLALLPSVLTAGGTQASSGSMRVSQSLALEFSAAARELSKGGAPGFFVSERIAGARRTTHLPWKGSAERLAKSALYSWYFASADFSEVLLAKSRNIQQSRYLKWGI